MLFYQLEGEKRIITQKSPYGKWADPCGERNSSDRDSWLSWLVDFGIQHQIRRRKMRNVRSLHRHSRESDSLSAVSPCSLDLNRRLVTAGHRVDPSHTTTKFFWANSGLAVLVIRCSGETGGTRAHQIVTMASSVATIHGAVGTTAHGRTTRSGSNMRPTKAVLRPHCKGPQVKHIGATLSASTCSFANGAQLGRTDTTGRRQQNSFSQRRLSVGCAAGPRKVRAHYPFERAY